MLGRVKLPARPPRSHDYLSLTDHVAVVSFTDAEGRSRRVRTRYKREGSGPPMLLVHGLMTTSYSWRFVIRALAERYDVIAPDLVGAGETEGPPDFVYSTYNMARFIRAFAAELTGEPVYLVGNSLGGLYSLASVLLPGGEAWARRFVLMHAPGYPSARMKVLHALLDAPLLGGPLGGLVSRVSHKTRRAFVAKNVHYHSDDMMSEEEVTEYGRIFETMQGARVFTRILRESLAPREHAELLARARERTDLPPTLLLFAREDVMVPPEFGPMFERDLAGSRLVWIDDASHFLQVDAPERTVREIFDFDAESATLTA
jgi:pimeloyl-ACP methyl ester carboxylesterase